MIDNKRTMVFHELQCFRIILYSTFFLFSVNGNTWDLAVSVGNEIDFYSSNGSLINQILMHEAAVLSGLAYDDSSRTIYFSDTKSTNVSMYSFHLTDDTEPKPLLNSEKGSHISAIVYDPKLQSIFWTDTAKHLIMKMKISTSEQIQSPTILHRLPEKSPSGLAIDVCNRYLYWTNSNMSNPSIERSNVDGTQRKVVIKDDLYEPIGIVIDHEAQKLYWIDDKEGIYYKIERSNLDGSARETVIEGKNHQPVFLAVDHENVYWTDWVSNTVWSIVKDAKIKNEYYPKIFANYQLSDRDLRPVNVIVRDEMESVKCSVVRGLDTVTRASTIDSYTTGSLESVQSYTNKTVKGDSKRKQVICSNNGHYNETDNICHCEPGFSGFSCEISACHNYCFDGECTIIKNGLPHCECSNASTGIRCERNKCDGYCLNDGTCYIVDGKPLCRCKYSNTTRCEDSNVHYIELCILYCAGGELTPNHTDITLCRCPESNQILKQVMNYSSILNYNIVVIVLGVLITVLVTTVGVLIYCVIKLKRRPRIKKRYVVNRTGITPLTSRPQLSGEQCEITIENCCNMNICETPCFEPKLRGAGRTIVKKDEKNGLLDNMENNIF